MSELPDATVDSARDEPRVLAPDSGKYGTKFEKELFAEAYELLSVVGLSPGMGALKLLRLAYRVGVRDALLGKGVGNG